MRRMECDLRRDSLCVSARGSWSLVPLGTGCFLLEFLAIYGLGQKASCGQSIPTQKLPSARIAFPQIFKWRLARVSITH
jgi:hypothetical protein